MNNLGNKTAVVCAGGGARGAYHIGVWKALRELDVPLSIATGTSVGALTAAIIAQGDYELAYDTFSNITNADVMDVPTENPTISSVARFFGSLAKKGGVDNSPLERLLRRCIDEDRIRSSDIALGLVTVRRKGLAPVELTIDEIPKGELVSYLLASSSIYPGFMPRKIGEETYIDGGYYNNVPIALAGDMGATDVIAVDLDSVGIDRPYRGGLPVRYIRSHWSLGSIFNFEKTTARRNIEQGHLDALRAFGVHEGMAYSFELGSLDSFCQATSVVDEARKLLSGGDLSSRAARGALSKHSDAHRNDRRMLIGLIEIAAELFEISPTDVYTPQKLNKLILEAPHEHSTKKNAVVTAAKRGAEADFSNTGILLSAKELVAAAYLAALIREQSRH